MCLTHGITVLTSNRMCIVQPDSSKGQPEPLITFYPVKRLLITDLADNTISTTLALLGLYTLALHAYFL
ncbi:hypothetical protein THIOM_000952 [Candidatus Thiomargarita nelsonii]|uniref:Uncharacterized protein n=1 Tax=Candidatus Thiomargarita nelsonii TaxID=1003181 RepID=A0A176S534_9GAMM|nr:hypothetical protein THIOM_000952 [Candidatus Thiomargarita nelsonii]